MNYYKKNLDYKDILLITLLGIALIFNIYALALFKGKVYKNRLNYNKILTNISNEEEFKKQIEINNSSLILNYGIIKSYEENLNLEEIYPSDFKSEKDFLNYLKN